MKGGASNWKKPDEVNSPGVARWIVFSCLFRLTSVDTSYAKIETETESAASPSGAANEMHSNDIGHIEHHPSGTETEKSIYQVSAVL